MLVDFSYHPQIHGWGWISFHLNEENAWDIILSSGSVIKRFFLKTFVCFFSFVKTSGYHLKVFVFKLN